ncbi:phosphonate C-P lyase system protein PhnG [Macrococcus capreoli]|uniref:phosphonate C-P lyase system protein PhnG n=1 Tax=Macrococcus capreoli TaxID=2982690 RepID=UPI0021D5E03B|nr:phosphonate C-P lyase system protein PhnG [Macrococcus sp. TMW 2.2395]MCU7556133.1 phosphonate C-P lyase system protein PhnG [Macrococcus sp. TMW 2.2395]
MLNRKRWSELLIRYGNQDAIDFYKKFRDQVNVEMVSQPTDGVVMLKVRETAQQSLFYMGEVTISETKMRVNGKLGLGIVHGSHELSEALAFIDGCYQAGIYLDELNELCARLELTEQDVIKHKTAEIMKTKVDFETMDV